MNPKARLALLSIFYEYTYLIIHTLYNTCAKELLGSADGILHYCLGPIFYALGLLIFGLALSFHSHVLTETIERYRIPGVLTLLTIPLFFVLFTCDSPGLFLFVLYSFMLLMGFRRVILYNKIVQAFTDQPRIGLFFAATLSTGILLQYLFQIIINSENVTLYSLILIGFLCALGEFMDVPEPLAEIAVTNPGASGKASSKTAISNAFWASVGAIILLEITANFLTYSLLSLFYAGNSLAFSTPRLFMALTYVGMGLLADKDDMKYIPLATLIGVLLGILNPILFHENSDGAGLFLNTCIYYITAGTINSFYILMMWKFAMKNRFAPLIAVSGHFIDAVFSALFISPFISDLPLAYAIGLELALIILIMILLVFSGQLNFAAQPIRTLEPANRISPELFSKYYDFSDKETEIFIAALKSTGSMSNLAKELYISRSVLYKYLHNICAKTGQETFQAVKNLYHNMNMSDMHDMPTSNNAGSANVMLPPDNADSTSPATHADAAAQADPMVPTEPTGSTVQKDQTDSAPENKKSIDTPKDADAQQNDKFKAFANAHKLSENECSALTLYLENPGKTQAELAELANVNLRTMQRRLAGVREKTGAASLTEVMKLFLSTNPPA